MMPSTPVAFDRTNRELRTNRFYFDAGADAVVEILWFEDIDIGVEVAPGDELAEITYAQEETEVIVAPPLCKGVIQFILPSIPVGRLRKQSQYLLSLEPSG